ASRKRDVLRHPEPRGRRRVEARLNDRQSSSNSEAAAACAERQPGSVAFRRGAGTGAWARTPVRGRGGDGERMSGTSAGAEMSPKHVSGKSGASPRRAWRPRSTTRMSRHTPRFVTRSREQVLTYSPHHLPQQIWTESGRLLDRV